MLSQIELPVNRMLALQQFLFPPGFKKEENEKVRKVNTERATVSPQ